MHTVGALSQLAASFRDAATAARSVKVPKRAAGAAPANPNLADALRRNEPHMQDFINELRRQGLLKG